MKLPHTEPCLKEKKLGKYYISLKNIQNIQNSKSKFHHFYDYKIHRLNMTSDENDNVHEVVPVPIKNVSPVILPVPSQ